MKKINILYGFLFLLSIMMTGCDEETDSISTVTSYPVFEMEGDEVISIVAGSTFSEPGVTATEGGEDIEVTTLGSVDTAVPGRYVITYSAVNSDGFRGSVTRTIIVTAEDVSGTDLSGTYIRGSATNIVTRLASGYYEANNGLGDGNGLVHQFIHTGGTNLLIPIQSTGFGRIQGTGTITGTGYTVTVQFLDPPNAGLNLTRSHTKQL